MDMPAITIVNTDEESTIGDAEAEVERDPPPPTSETRTRPRTADERALERARRARRRHLPK